MIKQSAVTRVPIIVFVAAAAVAVVLFDAFASLVSVRTGFPYEWFFVGSVLIYALTGAMTYRFAGSSVGSAALAALAVGIADATLGWWVSWTIGPGRPSFPTTPLLVAASAAFTMCIAAVTGVVGAFIARAVLR